MPVKLESLQTMPESLPIYNSRILKLYIEFLGEHYPDVSVDEILDHADVNKYEVEDPGHWFNQRQVDRFYEKMVASTGNTTIAREMGRFSASAKSTGPVKQRAIGLIRIASIYLFVAKIYPLVSRGSLATSRKLASNCVEITVVPHKDVRESPHQCENKIGFFEAIAKLVTGKYADVKHPECVHRGDKACRYIVKWEEPAHRLWKRYAFAIMGLTAVAAAISFPLLPLKVWLGALLSCGLVSGWLFFKSYLLEISELTYRLQNQGSLAEDHIKEIDYRYQGALLVQKIGQATSTILDVNELARIVLSNIQHYLDFDRGLIMLADSERRRLAYAAGYGFDDDMVALLDNTQFNLNNPEAKGVFINVFRTKKEILINDINSLRGSLSLKSQQFAKEIGSKSLICLPIVYEGDSLGILAVDNIITKRPLTKSDMNLLMGVAYQTAASIFSAKAFSELQESEERFRSLYENAPTAYISIDIEDAAIVNCNAAAVRLLGYDRSQLIGSCLHQYVADDKENQIRAEWVHGLIKKGQSVPNEALVLRHHEGHSIWVNVSLEPFKDPQGRVIEGRCILIDTTEQKQLEAQLQHAQRMETIGTMAGGVAHDLSNILAAIVSYPDLLLMDISPDSPLYEPLTKIKSAGHRAAVIVQDLLTLARHGVAVTEVVDINEVVASYLESPEYDSLLALHPDITIETDLNSDLAPVKGSPVHMAKAIMNILLNSAEAMPHGGSIRIATYNEDVADDDPRLKGDGGRYAVLEVSDNGQGISPEDLKRVFEPFFTKKVMGRSGTGLGMAIVWAAVQDHKGFVDIKSQVSRGTNVQLFFPATLEKRAVPPALCSLVEDISGQGETVLVVDDDVEHREIASLMLTKIGYHVETVSNGESAIAYIKKRQPDLVVLDMVLGSDPDGLSTYQEILAIRPNQKAIITSGFAQSGRVRKALDLGVGAYLRKPYGSREIGTAVRIELDRK